jgi:hypothetical protein
MEATLVCKVFFMSPKRKGLVNHDTSFDLLFMVKQSAA